MAGTAVLWLEMALFSKKVLLNIENIHNSVKTCDILLKKSFEKLGSGFVISEKKIFFGLGVAQGNPIFAQAGPKNSKFWKF